MSATPPPGTPLRILVCTKRDLAGCLILNRLLPALGDRAVGVLLSDKTRPAERTLPDLARFAAFERGFAVDRLFPHVDGLGAAAEGASARTFGALARRHRVPMETVDDVNGPEGLARLAAFAPDLLVSARFSLIFRGPALAVPRLGAFNIHPGALPEHAGLFAPFRQMLEGAGTIGCSLHRIDEGIDSGPLVGIGHTPVAAGRSLAWQVAHAYQPGIDLFLDLCARLERGEPVATRPQDRTRRRYRSLPEADEVAAFHARGFRLLNRADCHALAARFLPPGLPLPAALAGAVETLLAEGEV